jgi:hypothetical protein
MGSAFDDEAVDVEAVTDVQYTAVHDRNGVRYTGHNVRELFADYTLMHLSARHVVRLSTGRLDRVHRAATRYVGNGDEENLVGDPAAAALRAALVGRLDHMRGGAEVRDFWRDL